MAQDTDFGRDITSGVNDQLKAENISLAGETLHKPTDTDFSASVARMHDAGCDLIVLATIVRDSVQIISAVRKTGWTVDMLGQAASYDDVVAQVPGGATEGFYSMTPMLFVAETSEAPAVKAFAEAYRKEYGRNPNFAAQVGYTGAEVVVEALKNAGHDLTTDSFIASLEGIKSYHDIFGSPTISFSNTKHQGSNESFLCVVKDGKWQPVEVEPLGY
jgi:branched-chain amino acid transport system substrate-binding protein